MIIEYLKSISFLIPIYFENNMNNFDGDFQWFKLVYFTATLL